MPEPTGHVHGEEISRLVLSAHGKSHQPFLPQHYLLIFHTRNVKYEPLILQIFTSLKDYFKV